MKITDKDHDNTTHIGRIKKTQWNLIENYIYTNNNTLEDLQKLLEDLRREDNETD